MMGIALVNQSSAISNDEVHQIALACSAQLHVDVAHAWDIAHPLSVSALHHPSWYQFTLVDEIPEAPGALAYHDVDEQGRPYGRIGVKATLDAGETVSSAISHEAVELQCDIWCASWSFSNLLRCLVATEACDPVQDGTYAIDGVEVSNFVYPRYFADGFPAAHDGLRYDHLGTLTAPFATAKGGYQIRMKAGTVTNVFGDEFPAALRAAKEASHGRTYWRQIQAALATRED